MDQHQIRSDEPADPRPKIDGAAVAEAARQTAAGSQLIAYYVGAAAVVALIILVVLVSRGHTAGSGWIAGCCTMAFIGFGLFADYWFGRDHAYVAALVIEQDHAIRRASKSNAWAAPAVFSLLCSATAGLHRFAMWAKYSRVKIETSEVLFFLFVLVGTAIVAGILWYVVRRYGWIRGISIAYLMVSVCGAAVGAVAMLRSKPAVVAPPPIVQMPIKPSFPPGMSPVELAARAHGAAEDAKVAAYCVAPENLSAVKSMIKRHGRGEIAFIMIDATELTPDLRNAIYEGVGTELPANSVAHETPDRQFIEVVSAPIDRHYLKTRGLNLFEVVGSDESRQRIVVRPYLERVQNLAERQDAERQTQTLTCRLEEGFSGYLRQIRESFAAGEIVVVNIRHPKPGRSSDPYRIYRRLKTFGQVHAIIERHPHETLHYVIKHSGDFAKFVKELRLGIVVWVNEPNRTVSVDLRRPKPTLRLGDGTHAQIGWSLRDIERADLEDKYGESQVVLVRVESMPVDPAQRDFVCRLIRDGKESFHAYTGYPWYLLVAPVHDFADYTRKLQVLRTVDDPSAKEREITINIDRQAIIKMMEDADK